MDNTAATARKLVNVVCKLAAEKRSELERLKQEYSGLARPDFIWHYLLQSFSTMGRASGWYGLIGTPENYGRVSYEVLAALTPEARKTQVHQVCREAAIRMPDKKADYILGCFEYVKQLGGPEAAKARLLAEPGREGKIRFLESFPGIGPKYARNIMMDVYHEDFRDSVAVDARIKAVSEGLGLSFTSYAEHESFYLDVARRAGLNGWELDRLLFNFRPEVESRLGIRGAVANLAQAGSAEVSATIATSQVGAADPTTAQSAPSEPLPPRWESSYQRCDLLYSRDAIQRAIALWDDRNNGCRLSQIIAELDIALKTAQRLREEYKSSVEEDGDLLGTWESSRDGDGLYGWGVCQDCGCSLRAIQPASTISKGVCPWCEQASRPLCRVHRGQDEVKGRCPDCDQISLAEVQGGLVRFTTWACWNERSSVEKSSEAGVYLLAVFPENAVPVAADPYDSRVILIGCSQNMASRWEALHRRITGSCRGLRSMWKQMCKDVTNGKLDLASLYVSVSRVSDATGSTGKRKLKSLRTRLLGEYSDRNKRLPEYSERL